ncbi:MAG TPA: hypothetical protein DEA97_15605 [Bacteroidales bacterium]|nr:hypothetical protein [Bacteroidales bacterium]
MIAEPYKLKTIRNVEYTSMQDRIDALMAANYNTFHIPSYMVTFDMTSQGTSAVSQEQFAGLFTGDETYAGSRNFEHMCDVIKGLFSHTNVCPTHNLRGSHKLITATMVKEGDVIYGNSLKPVELIHDKDANMEILAVNDKTFPGNIDTAALDKELKGKTNIPYVYIELYADGFKPVSLANIKEASKIAKNNNTVLVVNGSYIIATADYIRKNESGYSNKTLKEIVYEIGSNSDIFVMDGGQDPRSNTGGFISTNIYELYDKYMNEVVVYEGLHTYGGMAGRTMEVFARGLAEMVYEKQAAWILFQTEKFASQLKNIPFYYGADGLYIKADEFLPKCESPAHTLAAAIYLKSGIRCFLEGRYDSSILPVQIPRMALTNEQLAEIATVINQVYAMRDKIAGLFLENAPEWNDDAMFKWNRPVMEEFFFKSEPFTIQQIEYIGETTEAERLEHAHESGFNTFLLQSKHVSIDFLTDSGTTAQTTTQWAAYLQSVETQATSENYFDFVETLQEITGYKYIIPTHQGRAAEHIMSQCLISGGVVPGNMYFTTTKLHQEMAGGTFADVICDEAHDPTNQFRWKGNIDLNKLKKLVDQHGAKNIPYISFEFSVNLAGGEPVHMDNAKEIYEYCESQGIYLMWDATRAVENAYMIKKHDERYHHASIKDILHEMFSYGHGCTVSSKKDYLVNIGGFLAIKDDEEFYYNALEMLRKYEGSITNGGMTAGDLAVHAQGVIEMVDYRYIKNRVEQTQYLGKRLLEAGVPIVEPVGSHAVFLDAKRFLPHIDQDQYPAQALATALYVDSGVRAMERGNVSKGRQPNGQNYRPSLELVRLTIPRRVYTNAHMDLVAESIIKLYKKRDQIKGLKFTYEPKNLRFFQGRFEEVK